MDAWGRAPFELASSAGTECDPLLFVVVGGAREWRGGQSVIEEGLHTTDTKGGGQPEQETWREAWRENIPRKEHTYEPARRLIRVLSGEQ